MNLLLQKANLLIRKERPDDNHQELITFFKRGSFLQINFKTRGCKYSKQGFCSMCNYGVGKEPDYDQLLNELDELLKNISLEKVNRLLLGSSGSFLDEYEIPTEIQNSIFERIAKTSVKNIIIETHYKTINIETLKRIQNYLKGKCIEIEVGLESTNKYVQNNIINKNIDLSLLKSTIKNIHRYGMTITINLLLGLPFINTSGQLEDTKNSIQWALDNNADYVVIFPINIQPYSLFEWMYFKDFIQPISLWLLVFLLNSLNENELNHTTISWYGNRSIQYKNYGETIHPTTCKHCSDFLMNAMDAFAEEKNLNKRKDIINMMINTPLSCDCKEKVESKICESPKFLFDEIKRFKDAIAKEVSESEYY